LQHAQDGVLNRRHIGAQHFSKQQRSDLLGSSNQMTWLVVEIQESGLGVVGDSMQQRSKGSADYGQR
jgi:hypothetical protein